MKYLIIDKRQRVNVVTMGKYPTAVTRLMEELEKREVPYHFAYNDELEFEFINGNTIIKAAGEDITGFSHIIFRGHYLHEHKEYQYKRLIIDHIDYYNQQNQDKKIFVHNAEAIKNFPYYNKIAMAMVCSQNDIPYFDTYFRTDGEYLKTRDILDDYPLIIKEYAGINRLQMIDGEEKVKKNVYKLNGNGCFNQKHLKGQNIRNYFIQKFSSTGKDMRIFVQNGKVVGGWIREAKKGFMTVSKGRYSMYNNPEDEIKNIAEKVAGVFKADFMAVDFMFIDNKPYIQEISFHPGFKAYETKIKGNSVDIAASIIDSF